MKRFLRVFAIRLALLFLPLVALIAYWEHAARQARLQTHHGDLGLGLGMVIMGGMLCAGLLLGLLIDLIVRVVYRHTLEIAVDLGFIVLMAMPVAWLCFMT